MRKTVQIILFEDHGSSPPLEFFKWQKLRRDGAGQCGVLRFLDHTHPTFPELLGDAVIRDDLADYDGPIVSLLRYLVVTIDVTNRQGFFVQGVVSTSVSESVEGRGGPQEPDCSCDPDFATVIRGTSAM